MATGINVLRENTVEEQTAEREAIVRILLDIQRDEGVTLLDIAETIGVSLGTISNAANKKTDLCRTYLKRLGKAFGGHYLDPFHALYGIRSVPIEAGNVRDILPLLAHAAATIAEARDPQSDGGGRVTHREKLAMLPELERLQTELAKAICDIQSLRVRAA